MTDSVGKYAHGAYPIWLPLGLNVMFRLTACNAPSHPQKRHPLDRCADTFHACGGSRPDYSKAVNAKSDLNI